MLFVPLISIYVEMGNRGLSRIIAISGLMMRYTFDLLIC